MKTTWFRRQLDKLHGGNSLTQWGYGRWFVYYPDGKRSATMYYSTANEYAEIFGGTVHHYSELPAREPV